MTQIVDEEGTERPVRFMSKTFGRAEENYTVTEKECMAVVWATDALRTLLLGVEFTLETDHDALKYLLKNKETVVEGIDHAVDAFVGLFQGKNTGKMVVKLA